MLRAVYLESVETIGIQEMHPTDQSLDCGSQNEQRSERSENKDAMRSDIVENGYTSLRKVEKLDSNRVSPNNKIQASETANNKSQSLTLPAPAENSPSKKDDIGTIPLYITVNEATNELNHGGNPPALSPQAVSLQTKLDNLSDEQIEQLMVKIDENLGADFNMHDHSEIIWEKVLNSPQLYFDEKGEVLASTTTPTIPTTTL